MPIVEARHRLEAPIEEVWKLICDLESYPKLMKPVRSVEVLETGPSWTISAWEIELKGSILRWIEREDRDASLYRVNYSQIEGDMEHFCGFWLLQPLGREVTLASLTVDFEIGIPMLSDMLNPVAERAIQENASTMLLSLAPPVRGVTC